MSRTQQLGARFWQQLLALMLMEPSPASRGLWERAGFDTMTVQELIDVLGI